jgi:hypothetical protein
MFNVPAHQSAKLQAELSKVYLYYFSYKRDKGLANFILAAKGHYPVMLEILYSVVSSWVKRNVFGMTLPNYGVCHADDLVMFFPMPWDSEVRSGGGDYDISVEIIRLWTSLAKDE